MIKPPLSYTIQTRQAENQRLTKNSQKRENSDTRMFDHAAIRAIEGEGNERKFILSFSSEEPYTRWWGTEILDHTEGAIDLVRLNDIGCLLYNHNRDKVIGKVSKAWIENSKGYAEVEFDTDAEAETIFQKVKSGTLKGVSVGYTIDSWEEVLANKTSADGRFQGPCEIARQWTPFEVSIVSIPADPTVGVGRSLEAKEAVDYSRFERQIQINNNFIGGLI